MNRNESWITTYGARQKMGTTTQFEWSKRWERKSVTDIPDRRDERLPDYPLNCHARSLSASAAKIGENFTTVTGTFFPKLFFLHDLPANQPIGNCLSRIDCARDARACRFQNLSDGCISPSADTGFAGFSGVIICAVLTAVSAFPPNPLTENRTRADHHHGRAIGNG